MMASSGIHDALFERLQKFDTDEQAYILAGFFGYMGHMLQDGRKSDKEFAERFFAEMDDFLEKHEKMWKKARA